MKIVFLVRDHPFKWDESSLENGMLGGTEECVVRVSSFLARKLEAEVFVFNQPPENKDFEHGGGVVKYRNYKEFDCFFGWDDLYLLDFNYLHNSELMNLSEPRKFFWVHNNVKDQFYLKQKHNFDKFLFVSEWQKKSVPDISNKLVVGNGVNVENFKKDAGKNPYYCMNTSSPRRGLLTLVRDIWPQVKNKTDAELHWFYGWEIFDWTGGDQDYKKRVKEKIEKTDGFYSHGRVSTIELKKKFEKANIWLYPTEFKETCCISALEAQASKTLPITTDVAALNQNVQFGYKSSCPDIYSNSKCQKELASKAVYYIENFDEARGEMRGSREWVKENRSWQRVFDNFLSLY